MDNIEVTTESEQKAMQEAAKTMILTQEELSIAIKKFKTAVANGGVNEY